MSTDLETAYKEHEHSFVGGRLCLDFINTVGSMRSDSPNNYIKSYRDLIDWGKQAGVLSKEEYAALVEKAGKDPEAAEETHRRALELRSASYAVILAAREGKQPSSKDMAVLNRELAKAYPHLVLEPGEDKHRYRWGWTAGKPALDSTLWHVARSVADLLTSEDLVRTGECADEHCGWLFYDTTRNHSRQWCDMGDCGNRA